MISKHWHRIRERAGLKDVRPYDLRRTCASWMAINGQNAIVIAKVLCHANLQHTHVYTRLNAKPVSEALNAHADQVFGYASRRVVEATRASPSEDPPPSMLVVPSLPVPASMPTGEGSSEEEEIEWPG